MSISAPLTTQNEGGCQQVPRLLRKMPRHHRRPTRPSAPRSAISATPAWQNGGGCHQVLRLPREAKRILLSATPATQREGDVKVDVAECHAGHAKYRSVTTTQPSKRARECDYSATPGT